MQQRPSPVTPRFLEMLRRALDTAAVLSSENPPAERQEPIRKVPKLAGERIPNRTDRDSKMPTIEKLRGETLETLAQILSDRL